jgi:hypothetical protein
MQRREFTTLMDTIAGRLAIVGGPLFLAERA